MGNLVENPLQWKRHILAKHHIQGGLTGGKGGGISKV